MTVCKFVQVHGRCNVRVPTLCSSVSDKGLPVTITVQPLDGRLPVALLGPGDIRPGDWLQDLGTLRQVDYIDTLGTVHVVHFRFQVGVPQMARGICNGVSITVWRVPDAQT